MSPGVFVPEWDDGRVAVGNGDSVSHWVHDDLRVRALAVAQPRSDDVTVLVAADLYMIFRADADAIRAKVDERLPRSYRRRGVDVEVLVGSTHNHHGPDTAFDVNHQWYEHMTDQAADAVVAALGRMQPARLRVGSGQHWFGMDDGGPQVIDPTMNVLQAVATDGDVVGTVVQWTPPTASTCPATGPKTDATCTDVGFATEDDPIVGTIRAGDHLQSEVGYLRIGPVGMMFLPGEVAGELVIGLPAGFRTDPAQWYEEAHELNAFGDAYTTPGYVHRRMHDRYEFTIGLGNDELGYVFPISNWRIRCVADDVAGPGTCAALHAAGVIDYPDGVAGTTCKAITEDPSRLSAYPPDAALAVSASCRYGQALGEAQGHYEETNSAGWDLAADILAAVAHLTGDPDPTQINRTFPGHWKGYPPPPAR